MPFAKISGKGQLTLPSEIRSKYGIDKASYVRVIPLEDSVKLVPVNKTGITLLDRLAASSAGRRIIPNPSFGISLPK